MLSIARRIAPHTVILIAVFALSLSMAACYGSVPSLCDNDYCAEAGADAGGVESAVGDGQHETSDAPNAVDGKGDVDGGACAAPTTLNCNGVCVDPTLPLHCGSCDNSCVGPDTGTGTTTCTAGTCGLGCTGTTTLNCSGACVDPSQPAHCGSCSNACPAPTTGTGTPICTLGGDGGGTCSVTCSGSTTETCGDSCYSPVDPNHCGSCTNACPAPPSGNGQATCAGATPTCGVTCAANYHTCNADCLANADEPSDASDPCILTETFGVFVSPAGSDITGTGTRAAPYATLGHGMDRAVAAGVARVYACATAGNYTENLVVSSARAGLTIYGGLNCTTSPSTWTYNASSKAVISPASSYAAQIQAAVTFEDFGFVASVASASAAANPSSVAVFVSSATGVVLERCSAQAGAGAPGQDQAQPTPYSTVAPGGHPGAAPVSLGGTGMGGAAATNTTCPTSIGGAGGSAKAGQLDGQTGQPGPGNAGTSLDCNMVPGVGGGPGQSGSEGSAGPGATTWATFSATAWTPSAGLPGGPGTVGQGGGGGGVQGALSGIGGGGGGGAGGCGGAQGSPGSGGGSSIAVLSYNSSLTLLTCTLTASSAGRGGNGAAGQIGQSPGGAGSGNGAAACSGGAGGQGGQGGPGGGGAGGVSAGIVWTGTAPTVTAGTQTVGTAGAAGKNGDGTTAAMAGTASGVVAFP